MNVFRKIITRQSQGSRLFQIHARSVQTSTDADAVRAAAVAARQGRGMRTQDAEPWDAPEPPYLSEACKKAGVQDWEPMYYSMFFGGLAILFIGEFYRPDRRIESWARDEAEERNRRVANGEDVVVGHNYAKGGDTRIIVGSQQPYEWQIGYGKPSRKQLSDD
eukprot:g1704.t1